MGDRSGKNSPEKISMQIKEPPPTHTTGAEKKYSYPEKIGIGIAICAALLTFPSFLLQTLIYNHNSAKAA